MPPTQPVRLVFFFGPRQGPPPSCPSLVVPWNFSPWGSYTSQRFIAGKTDSNRQKITSRCHTESETALAARMFAWHTWQKKWPQKNLPKWIPSLPCGRPGPKVVFSSTAPEDKNWKSHDISDCHKVEILAEQLPCKVIICFFWLVGVSTHKLSPSSSFTT